MSAVSRAGRERAWTASYREKRGEGRLGTFSQFISLPGPLWKLGHRRALLVGLLTCLLCALAYLSCTGRLAEDTTLHYAPLQPNIEDFSQKKEKPSLSPSLPKTHSSDSVPLRWPDPEDCTIEGEEDDNNYDGEKEEESEDEDILDEEEEEEEDDYFAEYENNLHVKYQKPLTSDNDSSLLTVDTPQYLPNFKNPCWFEPLPPSPLYDSNPYEKRSHLRKKFQLLEEMWERKRQHGETKRLRCLPYFYLAGMPKCGTTDLYYKLALHHDINSGLVKEPHWWTRTRIQPGMVYFGSKTNVPPRVQIQDYLDLFDKAAQCIATHKKEDENQHNMIVGDGSASTLWDNDAWHHLVENSENNTEPTYCVLHSIHRLQPDAKFIVILRDPVSRLWSDYLYFQRSNKTAESFDDRVRASIQLATECLMEKSILNCVSNKTLRGLTFRLTVGLYYVYLNEWLKVFPRNQIYILRLEDYTTDNVKHLNRIFEFLGLDPLSEDMVKAIKKMPNANTRRKKDLNQGAMWNSTRIILRDFYQPFNAKLVKLLNDPAYNWDYGS